METKSGDHREITHGIGLKSHKLTSYPTLKHIVHIQVVSENLKGMGEAAIHGAKSLHTREDNIMPVVNGWIV